MSNFLLCPSSLLPWSHHNPELVQLMNQKVTWGMISYISGLTSRICHMEKSTADVADNSIFCPAPIPLERFISNLVQASHVRVPTLLSTLIYLHRIKMRLPKETKFMPTSGHRLFLSCLVVAAKYLHDQSMPNKLWATYSAIFNVYEVNLMERHLLWMLNYDLRFNEFEACMLFAPLMPTATQRVRAEALQRVAKASQTRAMACTSVTQPQEKAPAPLKGQVVQACQVPQSQTATNTIASAVRGIAKRLSSSHLQRPPSVSVSSMYSVASDASTTDSEVGSLTDDNGSCSSSSESDLGTAGESDLESDHDVPMWNNVMLKPAPAYTARDPRRRKPSNSSVRSSVTIKAHNSPSRRMASSSSNSSKNGHRVSSYSNGNAGLVSSSTMPSLRSVSTSVTTASGFLSRMWGAAKGHAAAAVTAPPPPPSGEVVVDVVEPAESHSHFFFLHGQRDGALRRLAHSRSAVLRNGGDGSTLDD